MQDFVPLGTGNSRSLKSALSAGTTWEQALEMLRNGTFPIDIGAVNDAGVYQKGTSLGKGTLLDDAVAALYGKDTTAVPNDILQILSKAAILDGDFLKDVTGSISKSISNCTIWTTQYIGSSGSSSGSISLTFPKLPEIFFIVSTVQTRVVVCSPKLPGARNFFSDTTSESITPQVSGTTVTLSARYVNLNSSNYYVVAFIME